MSFTVVDRRDDHELEDAVRRGVADGLARMLGVPKTLTAFKRSSTRIVSRKITASPYLKLQRVCTKGTIKRFPPLHRDHEASVVE